MGFRGVFGGSLVALARRRVKVAPSVTPTSEWGRQAGHANPNNFGREGVTLNSQMRLALFRGCKSMTVMVVVVLLGEIRVANIFLYGMSP